MKTVRAIAQFLAGKKTYVVGAIGIGYAFGISCSWWQSNVTIWGVLGSAGAITLRAAIAKLCAQALAAPLSGASTIPLAAASEISPGDKIFGQPHRTTHKKHK